ncbi:class I SAM-dependent methyltransferase [Nocardia salmonicida]|uniref:class I SAM-dependent methyltransferase n=1 Tax=Nocardia salmonicida TaxID=53431 RepID=UPI000A024FF7|nr:methyltransferase domain-containing protein [Nocardia salmonicida]MBC7299476.1 class I SAM-dependent methyltransferase [Nocardia sp.]
MSGTSSSASTPPSWPVQPGYREDLFRGTAEYYSQYRPAYPVSLFEDLLARTGQGGGLLIDLACGTGEIAIPLHDRFTHVQAVDLEPDMVEVGRRKAVESGATNIDWSVGRAEDPVVTAPAQLVTIGNAFHRLDRGLIAERAGQWLDPGGCLAIVGSSTPWSGTEPWQAIAVDVVARWSGEPGRPASTSPAAVDSSVSPRRTHEEILREAGFLDVTEDQFPTPHVWTVDEFLGFLWSTSYATQIRQDPALAEQFEKDLRAQLLDFEPSGQLQESIAHYYILGRTPDPSRT